MLRAGAAAVLLVIVVLASGCRNLPENIPSLPMPAPTPPDATATSRHLTAAPGTGAAPEVILVPNRTRGPAALTAGLVAPVRMQIGPQPFVVESCNLKSGDRVRIAVRDAGGEEPVYVREYSLAGGLVSSGLTAGECTPAAGEYEAELWVNGQLLDSRPFRVQ
ncbi:MAG: hypothetical protein MUE73_09110 [Planctomycetes bacterium]|nr:hypothetical protein [Planctomycetota bacterium]